MPSWWDSRFGPYHMNVPEDVWSRICMLPTDQEKHDAVAAYIDASQK